MVNVLVVSANKNVLLLLLVIKDNGMSVVTIKGHVLNKKNKFYSK
jgi:hypothetical protein